jgi:hypothetical protein
MSGPFEQIIRRALDQLLRSPLRHIPGPLPAKLTAQWLFWIGVAGRRSSYLHRLHQRYGPVVRVGPNEVSFASAAAAQDIYVGVPLSGLADGDTPLAPQQPFAKDAAAVSHGSGSRRFHRHDEQYNVASLSTEAQAPTAFASTTAASAATTAAPTAASYSTAAQQLPSLLRRQSSQQRRLFPKSAFYDVMGRKSLFSMRDEAEHRQRLKHIGHWFSPAWLVDMEHVISEEITQLLARLDDVRGREVDALYIFRMLGLDVISMAPPPPLFLILPYRLSVEFCNASSLPLLYDLLPYIWFSNRRVFPSTMPSMLDRRLLIMTLIHLTPPSRPSFPRKVVRGAQEQQDAGNHALHR